MADESSLVDRQAVQRFVKNIDWNAFYQFHQIVEAGSISAAARQLNVHQPGLSLALKRFEEQLGVKLCRRSPQGIEVTPAGRAVWELINNAFDIIRMVPHAAIRAANKVDGTLRLGMISNIVSPALDTALSVFTQAHPDVKLSIDILTWQEVLDAVIAGDCDIGLTYESDSVPTLHYEPIVWESQQLYCGRNHRLFGKTVGNPALLSRQRFVLAQGDEPKDVERFRLHYALGRHVGARADDLSEAMRLIQLGVGVGFLPTIVADTAGDKLWPLLPASLLPSYFVYMISLEVSLLSTPAQLFHEEMRQSMREYTTFR